MSEPSAAGPLFILAMDQRDSFQRTLFDVTGTPSAEQLARMRDAKSLIFTAARRLAGTQPPPVTWASWSTSSSGPTSPARPGRPASSWPCRWR